MQHNDELMSSITQRYPWMLSLKPADRHACATEIMMASSAAAEEASLVITAWRETAEAIAAGLGQMPVEWLDAEVPVPRP